jgi:hypothetical protein
MRKATNVKRPRQRNGLAMNNDFARRIILITMMLVAV